MFESRVLLLACAGALWWIAAPARHRCACPAGWRATVALPSACIDHIAYSTISAGLQLNLRIWSSIWFGIYGGHTLHRRFEPRNEKDQSISDQIQRMPDAWLIRGGVTWRLPRGS